MSLSLLPFVAGITLECTIDTPPIERAKSTSAGMVEVSLSELEDWQVELEDRSIRGGFTTRAEAGIARRDGQHVPRHVQDMIRRMTDQQGQAT